jgi:glyoxylase-like metal-dependent hydrolase (beta-lactamase superfamily II)
MGATWQILAIRFARLTRRYRDALLLCPEPLADQPLDMDYSFWVLRRDERTIVVDTGYSSALADARGRRFLADPIVTLRATGIEPATVDDVVLTHLHYDHAGNLEHFPQATLHVHHAERDPAEGWQAAEPAVGFAYEGSHLRELARAEAQGRLDLLGGDTTLTDGVDLHHLPGHTPGHLGVRVRTARGSVLLAGDSVHVEANLRERRPFPLYSCLRSTFRDYDRVAELAGRPDLLVPGHEASVIDRYPAATPELAGRVARLDLEPTT